MASLVNQQILLYTDTVLSSKEIDSVFKSFMVPVIYMTIYTCFHIIKQLQFKGNLRTKFFLYFWTKGNITLQFCTYIGSDEMGP